MHRIPQEDIRGKTIETWCFSWCDVTGMWREIDEAFKNNERFIPQWINALEKWLDWKTKSTKKKIVSSNGWAAERAWWAGAVVGTLKVTRNRGTKQ